MCLPEGQFKPGIGIIACKALFKKNHTIILLQLYIFYLLFNTISLVSYLIPSNEQLDYQTQFLGRWGQGFVLWSSLRYTSSHAAVTPYLSWLGMFKKFSHFPFKAAGQRMWYFPLNWIERLWDARWRLWGMTTDFSKAVNQNHLKTEANASSPLIDLTEHSGHEDQMHAAHRNCCLDQLANDTIRTH